ncbi:MAG: hypothetical protein VXY83_02215 [Pseudomonadota bacterium]|nr:hypothetical protein [Pseudomonadota bacterium]
MAWQKGNENDYQKTGVKAPVFLCPQKAKKRVFVDVLNGKVQLEYSYDPVQNFHPTGQDMQWHKLESGLIENDFAFETIGVSAVRLRVMDTGEDGVKLQIYEKSEC